MQTLTIYGAQSSLDLTKKIQAIKALRNHARITLSDAMRHLNHLPARVEVPDCEVEELSRILGGCGLSVLYAE